MENFVAKKCKSYEFVNSIYYQLIEDSRKARLFQKDFEMQKKLELNLEISKFSLVIKNLEDVLKTFQIELGSPYLNENQLRDITKQHLS